MVYSIGPKNSWKREGATVNVVVRKIQRRTIRAIKLLLQWLVVLRQFQSIRSVKSPRFSVKWRDRWLHLRDATATTSFDRHYVFHTAWAARVLSERQPSKHVDIASSLYFVSSISAYIETHFIDFRPAHLGLSGLSSSAGTVLELPFGNNTVESLSCMHVVEHVGLGRYGDPFDYDGDLKAISELKRVLKNDGILLFVVPIGGVARIQFNAHRIYTYQQVVDMFSELTLLEFSLIPDDGAEEGLIRNATVEQANKQRYGCGCFLFKRTDK